MLGSVFSVICLGVALVALFKGEPVVGLACLAASVIVYVITQDGFSFPTLR